MRKKLVIFGAGEQAEVAFYYFKNFTSFDVVAFTVDDEFADVQSPALGVPIVPKSDLSSNFDNENHTAFVAIGYSKMNELRKQKFSEMKAMGYNLATYVSEKASVFSDEVGENCFILEDNTIQPFVAIGNNVTLWSGNHVGHHSRIDDDCFITSQVVISGGCRIGERSFIGVNSTLRDHIRIGRANMIGAGCLILSDTEDNAVYTTKMTEKSRVPSNRLRGI